MVRAVVPRIQGDEYQSRWLWMQICRLFEERSKVERIVYEDDGIKYFDDVTTIYTARYVR